MGAILGRVLRSGKHGAIAFRRTAARCHNDTKTEDRSRHAFREEGFSVHYSEMNSVEDQFISSKASKTVRANRNEL